MAQIRSKLPKQTQVQLIDLFVQGTSARKAALQIGVQANTAARYYNKIRDVISLNLGEDIAVHRSEPEKQADLRFVETSVSDRIPLFVIWKFRGRLRTTYIFGHKPNEYAYDHRSLAVPHSVVYWVGKSSSKNIHIENLQYERVRRQEYSAEPKGTSTRTADDFWMHYKHMLKHYKSVPIKQIRSHLNECEFRFVFDGEQQQIAKLREWCSLQ